MNPEVDLVERYGDRMVEHQKLGVRLPLSQMIDACPIPEDQRDQSKHNEYAARFLLESGHELQEDEVPQSVLDQYQERLEFGSVSEPVEAEPEPAKKKLKSKLLHALGRDTL